MLHQSKDKDTKNVELPYDTLPAAAMVDLPQPDTPMTTIRRMPQRPWAAMHSGTGVSSGWPLKPA